MFQGFSQQTGDFLWSLALNNDRTWFKANKQTFEDVLNQPFRALAADTLERMQALYPSQDFQSHVSRIYRDARRLFGRGPFKDHLWFTVHSGDRHAVGPMFWFEVDRVSWSYGMGIWDDSTDVPAAFRAAVDADPARFEALVRDIAGYGPYKLWGPEYKRPKGDRGELLNPWYNRKHFSVGYEHGYGGPLFDETLPDVLVRDFQRLMPMYHFLKEVYNAVLIERAGRPGKG